MAQFTFSSIANRSVSELMVIIIGILIALAVDDWWGDRQDRIEEAQILQAIREDVGVSLDLTRRTVDRVRADRAHLMTLSRGSHGEAAGLEPAAMAALIHALWDVPPLNVQMSAYDEIEDSGRLRLISAPALRRQLARYREAYEFARLAHLDAFQNQHQKLDPYLLANVQLAQIAPQALANDAGVAPELIEPLPPLRDHRVLLDDPLFQNQVAAKYFLLSYYLDQTTAVIEALAAVDEEIARQESVVRVAPVK